MPAHAQTSCRSAISRALPSRLPIPAPSEHSALFRASCRARAPSSQPARSIIPAEFAAASEETKALLGLSKVLTVTCTYDHRIIQGAESGAFLAKLQQFLLGEDGFYEGIFRDLKIPYMPVRWQSDQQITPGRFGTGPTNTDVAKEAAVIQLINSYRIRGHLSLTSILSATIRLIIPSSTPPATDSLIWDLDRPFLAGAVKAPSGAIASYMQPFETLREILDRLRATYCGSIGIEYMHIQDPHRSSGFRTAWRAPLTPGSSTIQCAAVFSTACFRPRSSSISCRRALSARSAMASKAWRALLLCWTKFSSGAANENVHEAVIGMAHRGRLNVLANVVGKSMTQVFSEFEGEPDPESVQGSGDVKYHLGASGIHRSTQGKEILVSVAFNPSHLEAVDPVVEGLVRPKQDRIGDDKRERVLPDPDSRRRSAHRPGRCG